MSSSSVASPQLSVTESGSPVVSSTESDSSLEPFATHFRHLEVLQKTLEELNVKLRQLQGEASEEDKNTDKEDLKESDEEEENESVEEEPKGNNERDQHGSDEEEENESDEEEPKGNNKRDQHGSDEEKQSENDQENQHANDQENKQESDQEYQKEKDAQYEREMLEYCKSQLERYGLEYKILETDEEEWKLKRTILEEILHPKVECKSMEFVHKNFPWNGFLTEHGSSLRDVIKTSNDFFSPDGRRLLEQCMVDIDEQLVEVERLKKPTGEVLDKIKKRLNKTSA